MLSSAAVGSAAAYGSYVAVCGSGESCLGGAFAGAGVDVVATPLVIWGLGGAMGGRGDLPSTFVGSMLSFLVASPLVSKDADLALGVSLALMPVSGSLIYELRSDQASRGLRIAQRSSRLPVRLVGLDLVPMQGGARAQISGVLS
jgi:hypothetical protein